MSIHAANASVISESDSIRVRHAVETDANRIREIYLATYGTEYAYPQFYDAERIKKAIFADDTINTPSMLAVEDHLDALAWAESLEIGRAHV